MRTSTKILIILAIITFIPGIFLTPYLVKAIVPTGTGFTFNFTALAWLAVVQQVIFNVIFTILFIRFLRTQRLSNVIFFSLAPLSVVYGALMVYLVAVEDLEDDLSASVRATLNIQTQSTSYTNYLWAGVVTLVYLVLVFFIVLFACKPLSKVQKFTENLGDGRTKTDDYRVGGGKQFREIENSLNKINYNYKEKENKLRKTSLGKGMSKQFLKFFSKSEIQQLEMGQHVKKDSTTLLCKLKSATDPHSLSLEENFNYINSYIKIVSPLISKFDGFIDKFLGDGVLAVFAKPQQAIECAHAIIRAVDVKNKSQKQLPIIDARMCINTSDVIFALFGDEAKTDVGIISDVLNLACKMEEISRFIGVRVLITKSTISALPHKFEFNHRFVGTLSFEEEEEISLFESLDYHKKSKREKLKNLKNDFEAGVRAYNEKNYLSAKSFFEYVLRYVNDDKPSYVYFNRAVEKLKENTEN